MSPRRLYLDDAPGESRGVVALDGRPERLLIARPGDAPVQQAGARAIGRVRRVEKGLATAFLDLGEGPDAVLALSAAKGVSEGQALEVEVAAPARGGKGPSVRLIGPGAGAPRLVTPAPDLATQLRGHAPGVEIVGGTAARDAAEVAEAAALAIEHPLGEGATLAIEPTRALVAVDVDVGGAGGGDARRGAMRVNRRAVAETARLLRLKGLGGLVVIDFAGAGLDGPAILEAGRLAFAPDMPGVGYGPVSRFGVWQLTLPWRTRPLAEILLGADGRPTVETEALRLARAIERQAAHGPRVRAVCAPEVAAAMEGLKPALLARLGPRFDIVGDPAASRLQPDVRLS